MSDEQEHDMEWHFRVMDNLLAEMGSLFERWTECAEAYDKVSAVVNGNDEWRQEFAAREKARIVAGEEGETHTVRCGACGNMRDSAGHELGCEVGRQEYGHGELGS